MHVARQPMHEIRRSLVREVEAALPGPPLQGFRLVRLVELVQLMDGRREQARSKIGQLERDARGWLGTGHVQASGAILHQRVQAEDRGTPCRIAHRSIEPVQADQVEGLATFEPGRFGRCFEVEVGRGSSAFPGRCAGGLQQVRPARPARPQSQTTRGAARLPSASSATTSALRPGT